VVCFYSALDTDFGSKKAETLIHGGVRLFRRAEKMKHCHTCTADPNRNLAIGFRLKTGPDLLDVYLGNLQLVCQNVEVFG